MVSYRIKVKTDADGSRYYPQYKGSLPDVEDNESLDMELIVFTIFLTIISLGSVWILVLIDTLFFWKGFNASYWSDEIHGFDSEFLAREFVYGRTEKAKEYAKEKIRVKNLNKKVKKTRYIKL